MQNEENDVLEEIEMLMNKWLQFDENIIKIKNNLKELTIQKKITEDKIIELMQSHKKEELLLKSSGQRIKLSTNNVKKKKNITDIKNLLNQMLSIEDYNKINTEIDVPQSITSKTILKKYKS